MNTRVPYPCTECKKKTEYCTTFQKCVRFRNWVSSKHISKDERERQLEEKRKYKEHIQWMLDNLVSAHW